MFVHTVYFWQRPGTPKSACDQLVKDCHTYLASVPTVRQLFAGPPAMTPRDVVDNSYSVGLTVIFNDRSAHDIYQLHSLHEEFIRRNKKHWGRVQVYDCQ